jgi:hypothetical protein
MAGGLGQPSTHLASCLSLLLLELLLRLCPLAALGKRQQVAKSLGAVPDGLEPGICTGSSRQQPCQ